MVLADPFFANCHNVGIWSCLQISRIYHSNCITQVSIVRIIPVSLFLNIRGDRIYLKYFVTYGTAWSKWGTTFGCTLHHIVVQVSYGKSKFFCQGGLLLYIKCPCLPRSNRYHYFSGYGLRWYYRTSILCYT